MKRILLALILIGGCLLAPEKVERVRLDIQPVIDYYPLGGYVDAAGEALYVLSGDVEQVKKELAGIVIEGKTPRLEFSAEENLNFVIFRGVFSTGGHGISINRVEREGSTFFIYAIYSDPGRDSIVTQAFTQPTAILPLGTLKSGSYEARLFVIKTLMSKDGEKISEEENEIAKVSFSVT